MRFQALRHPCIFGPESKPSRRKALLHKPKSLTVICKTLYGCSSAVSKNEQATGKWIALQRLFTDSGQSIYTVPEINSFNRHQDPHLRGDLDHRLLLQKVLLSVFRSGTPMPLMWTLIFAPFRVSSSMTHSGVGPETAGLSSIKD